MNNPPMVAPIVEGHGEVTAVRELIRRIGFDLLDGTYIEVAQPFRLDSGKMRKPDELAKAIRVQSARILECGGILVLRDGDDDVNCAPELAALLRPHAVRDNAVAPENPEGKRDAKHELEKLMLESYKETLHQAKFSALIDLKTAKQNSRSFRRLVHAVELLISSEPS